MQEGETSRTPLWFEIIPYFEGLRGGKFACVVVSFTTLRHTNRPWNVTPTLPQNPVANRCNAWFWPEWGLKTVTEVQEVCSLQKRDRIKSSRYMSCMKMYVSLYLLGLHLSKIASPSDSSACPCIIISCIYTGVFSPPRDFTSAENFKQMFSWPHYVRFRWREIKCRGNVEGIEGRCPCVTHLNVDCVVWKNYSTPLFIIANLTVVTLPKNVLSFTWSIISKWWNV